MKITIAEYVSMAETGSSLLDLMQNNKTPVLDLLVRESIQNSLDASRAGEDFVKVEFLLRDVDTHNIAKHFEDVDLEGKHPGMHKLLAIRDSNTVGLEGPISKDDVKPRHDMGRFLNLVTEICKAQKNLESGGSWGIGKTIYYRVGIGLVLFYTRIKDRNGYSSRLAAVCVEDEINDYQNNIIQYADDVHPRGIAWWGERKDDGQFIPIVDENIIVNILKDFNVPTYSGDETGTTIIIPFLNEEKMLNEVQVIDNKKSKSPRWIGNIGLYIKMAVQRWYAPRLNNTLYPFGPWLEAYIDDEAEGIFQITNLPFFDVIQSLYNVTFELEKDPKAKDFHYKNIAIESEPINIQKTLKKSLAGYLHTIKIKNSDLTEYGTVHVTPPFLCIQNELPEGKENPPIFAYVRKPGMIVSYCTPGEWCANVPYTKKDEYIIALFVANSRNVLADMPKLTLEEYLRQSEMADHMDWEDNNRIPGLPRKMYIVSKLKKHVNNKLKDKYTDKKPPVPGTSNINKQLGKCLADLLLPSTLKATKPGFGLGKGNTGLGIGADPIPEDTITGGMPKRQGPLLRITGGPYFKDGNIVIDVNVIMNQCPHTQIILKVATEKNSVGLFDWNKQVKLNFPGTFVSAPIKYKVYELLGGKKIEIKNLDSFGMYYATSVVGNEVLDLVDVKAPVDRLYALSASLTYKVDTNVRLDIDVKEVK